MSNSFTADLSVIENRLTATRAGYLDNLSAGAVAQAGVYTAARAGYIDNLSVGAAALETTAQAIPTTPINKIVHLYGKVDIGSSYDIVTIAEVVIAKTTIGLLTATGNTAAPLNLDDALNPSIPTTTTFRVDTWATPSVDTNFNAWLVEYN